MACGYRFVTVAGRLWVLGLVGGVLDARARWWAHGRMVFFVPPAWSSWSSVRADSCPADRSSAIHRDLPRVSRWTTERADFGSEVTLAKRSHRPRQSKWRGGGGSLSAILAPTSEPAALAVADTFDSRYSKWPPPQCANLRAGRDKLPASRAFPEGERPTGRGGSQTWTGGGAHCWEREVRLL